MTYLEVWGRLVLDAERSGMSTKEASRWATESLASARRTRTPAGPGSGPSVTTTMNLGDGLSHRTSQAVEALARQQWAEAETDMTRLDRQMERTRGRARGLALAIEAGYLF